MRPRATPRQQSEQVSFSTFNLPTTGVGYSGDHAVLEKNSELTQIKLTKRDTDRMREINDLSRSISNFPLLGIASDTDSLYQTGKLGQHFEQGSELVIDKDAEEQLEREYQLAQMKKLNSLLTIAGFELFQSVPFLSNSKGSY